MFLSCRSISLNSIQSSEEWNLHPWEIQQIRPDLAQSFRETGILHPPIVREKSKEHFTLIDGFKRLQFIKNEVNPPQVTCMVVDGNAPSTYILDMILSDQDSGSPLSFAEKARFVEIALKFLSPREIQKKYLPRLGLKQTPSTVSLLLKLLKQDRIIIREVHEDRLREKMVMEILNLHEEEDRLVLVHLFSQLRMGDGKQKRFFNLIRDNAFRVDLSIKAYLDRKKIQEILNHRELNVPQIIAHLGTYLQQQLAPSLASAEEDFIQQVNKLQLPPGHSITHSPSFEKDEVTLTVRFNNLSECRKYLSHKY